MGFMPTKLSEECKLTYPSSMTYLHDTYIHLDIHTHPESEWVRERKRERSRERKRDREEGMREGVCMIAEIFNNNLLY